MATAFLIPMSAVALIVGRNVPALVLELTDGM